MLLALRRGSLPPLLDFPHATTARLGSKQCHAKPQPKNGAVAGVAEFIFQGQKAVESRITQVTGVEFAGHKECWMWY